MANEIGTNMPTAPAVTTSIKNASSGATSAATGAKSGSESLGRDDFMKLLVAQLKNQDPNNPLDTKDLVTQLSQLTSVEQLVSIGDKMGKLEAATNGMAANQSAGLIGRTIQGSADSTQLGSTGPATVAVKLSQSATKVSVNVVNDAGRVVRTIDLEGGLAAGPQKIEWDGKNDSSERAPKGTYTFQVDAKDQNGVPVETDMKVSGIVTSVSYENGYPEVLIGTTRVPLSSVSSISQ